MLARYGICICRLFRIQRRWRILGVAVAYLAGLLVLHLLEDPLLYRPKRFQASENSAAHSGMQDVWLRGADDLLVHAWWRPRPGTQRAVLLCHGNASNVFRQADTIRLIAEVLNANVLAFDYPGFGRSEGAPSEAGCYAAGDAAYDWLVHRVPPAEVILLGESLGGGVATDLARRRPHAALALFKTFTSFPDVAEALIPVVPARWLAHNHFENIRKIGQCAGPIFIAHGDCDHLIPFSQAQRLFAAAAAPKQFLRLEGRGHHGGIPPEFLNALARFLNEQRAVEGRKAATTPSHPEASNQAGRSAG